MKALYKTLMATVATLLLVPAAYAQPEASEYRDHVSGFGFNKYVTSTTPNENGEYTLRIETFATGTVTVAKKSIPSDIVLVLDASGSMSSNKMVHPTLRIRRGATGKYSYSSGFAGTSSAGCFWIRIPDTDEGVLYPVIHGHDKIDGSTTYNDHWLYFVKDGTTYYLNGKNTDADRGIKETKPAPGTFPDENTTIWTGPLYSYPQRTEALKNAVKGFIDKIEENDREDVQPYLRNGQTGNQISIVQYHGDSKSQNITTSEGDSNTKPLIGFTPVKDNVAALKTAVNGLPASSNTPHDAGFKVAQLLLQDLNATTPAFVGTTRQRLRTVVFFTDGQPAGGNGGYWIKKYTLDIANELKKHYDDPNENQEVKIFTIAFNPRTGTGEKNDRGFLQHVSSNYKADCDIATSTYALSGTQSDGDQIYYMDAADPNMDMDSIFEFIASNVGGGSTSDYGNTPLLAVDMVSSSFQLPPNADKSRVKVYTAQCLGKTGETVTDDQGDEHDVLAFAEPVLAKERGDVTYYASAAVVDGEGKPVLDPETQQPKYEWTEVTTDIDADIDVTFDKTTNTVSVGGFDYENLWCGYDPEHENPEYYDSTDSNYGYHETGYRGFKIIIEFPIVIKEGATGGPSVLTNLTSSGLYQTDAQGGKTGLPIIEYPQPHLPIPINLWIEKHGLKYGESASFTILRKLVEKENPEDPDPVYEPFTKILLTGSADGQPVVAKLLSLDPIYYYKVWEEGWAWSYSNQAQDLETAPTTETFTNNKIVIKNTYDDPDIKHAEAKATNKMRETGSTIGSSTETVPAQ